MLWASHRILGDRSSSLVSHVSEARCCVRAFFVPLYLGVVMLQWTWNHGRKRVCSTAALTRMMEELMTGPKKSLRPITAQDLYALQLLTDVRISPDARQVVYGVQRVDRKTEKKYANLWMAAVDGSGERQFTQGDQTDASPRWSPDGRMLAFLSSRKEGEDAQVYLIDVTRRGARLTDRKGDISSLTWSPMQESPAGVHGEGQGSHRPRGGRAEEDAGVRIASLHAAVLPRRLARAVWP